MKSTSRICATTLGAAALAASFAAAACGDQASADSLEKKLGLTPSVFGSARTASQAPSVAASGTESDRSGPSDLSQWASGASKQQPQSPSPQPKDSAVLARFHAW